MGKRFLPVVALILSVAMICAGQQSAPQNAAPSQSPVLKIGVTLVQVDAVVTDKHGNQIKDLTPDDFEVFQDGRKQQITNFSYINTVSKVDTASTESRGGSPSVKATGKSSDKSALYVPPAPLKPEQVQRTITLVADDLNLSWEGAIHTRQAMGRFVDQELQPGDLVAVIRTGGGIGALQQFTSNKRQLHAAIDHIGWDPTGYGKIGGFDPIEPRLNPRSQLGDKQSLADELRVQAFSVGTLGALNYIIKGLSTLPGRKSLILFSEGIVRFDQSFRRSGEHDPYGDNTVYSAILELADLANRASVVIYTIDARGLVYVGMTAADRQTFTTIHEQEMSAQAMDSQLSRRRHGLYASQETLEDLAGETGGLALINNNDLFKGMQRAANDQSGYYLIGFVPDEKTFKPVNGARAFHDIKVTIKRPNLHIRYHHGFYGLTDEEVHESETGAEQLYTALVSPFSTGDLNVKLTSLFSNSKQAGSFVRSLIHIDARDLVFSEKEDGTHTAVVDVTAMTFGDNGRVVNAVNRTQTLLVNANEYSELLERGLLYSINVPIKKAGPYQLRVAVRDASSKKVGSASQLIEVPDISSRRLAVSGIELRGLGEPSQIGAGGGHEAGSGGSSTSASPGLPAGSSVLPAGERGAAAAGTGGQGLGSSDSPSVRIFHPGENLDLGFIIFNAKLEKSTLKPNLQVQLRFFRDGDLVIDGPASPFSPAEIEDAARLGAGGSFKLGPNMPEGHYVVQVVCNDMLASEKHRTASAWIDFDIKP